MLVKNSSSAEKKQESIELLSKIKNISNCSEGDLSPAFSTKDSNGQTPLDIVQDPTMLELLGSFSAKFSNGDTLLHHEVANGNIEMVAKLLKMVPMLI